MPLTLHPSDINTEQDFWDAFGHSETETSANWVVRFCTARDNTWRPFTYEEINTWAQQNGHGGELRLNRLPEQNLLRLDDEKRYVIANEFISACFRVAGTWARPEEV